MQKELLATAGGRFFLPSEQITPSRTNSEPELGQLCVSRGGAAGQQGQLLSQTFPATPALHFSSAGTECHPSLAQSFLHLFPTLICPSLVWDTCPGLAMAGHTWERWERLQGKSQELGRCWNLQPCPLSLGELSPLPQHCSHCSHSLPSPSSPSQVLPPSVQPAPNPAWVTLVG